MRPSIQPVNLLFTSAGRRVELLTAFKDAYRALNLPGRLVATDIDALAPTLQVADKVYLVPRFTAPEYISALAEVCQREQIHAVFPLIDPDIPLLAQNRVAIEATGARLAVVSDHAAKIAADKWLTYQFYVSNGIPTPRSWLPEQLDESDLPEFPLFIKPRFGSASADSFKVQNRKELDFFRDYIPRAIIQEYLPGAEITSDVVCDLEGELLAIVLRQRLQVRAGEVARGKTILNPVIIDYCRQIAARLPAIGPVTVQCIMKDDRPYFTEINARLGGGAPLAVAAGVDFPKWLLARIADIPLELPPVGTYQVPVYLTRFDHAFYLSEQDLARLEGSRL